MESHDEKESDQLLSPSITKSPPIDIQHSKIREVNNHNCKSWDGKLEVFSNKSASWKNAESFPPSSEKIEDIDICPQSGHLKYINSKFVLYNALSNCKSAGVIPYTIHRKKTLFLFQRLDKPLRKKDAGWNDFGGKRMFLNESTAEIAAREFCEETSCLFYLVERGDEESQRLYDNLKNKDDLTYDERIVRDLKKLIPVAQKFYYDRITEYVIPIHVSSKETYISYFVKVKYIPASDIPKAEDIHINYNVRYLRTCRWFSFEELMCLDEEEFHKRLRITKIKQRIDNYRARGFFN
ncbi:MAG: hypothetical protein QW303_05960 [Nitrososphaerota archaeon]